MPIGVEKPAASELPKDIKCERCGPCAPSQPVLAQHSLYSVSKMASLMASRLTGGTMRPAAVVRPFATRAPVSMVARPSSGSVFLGGVCRRHEAAAWDAVTCPRARLHQAAARPSQQQSQPQPCAAFAAQLVGFSSGSSASWLRRCTTLSSTRRPGLTLS